MPTDLRLTVLNDPACPLCRRFADWLARQPLLVPLDLVPAGSAEARTRFPTLDHARTAEEITVIGSDGSVWTREHAWVMCLWATRSHRGAALRLSRPSLLPLARGAAYSAAGVRHLLSRTQVGDRLQVEVHGGDYADGCAGCRPLPQG
ncbi:DCC1-like thiol-disulfide oxidoreductase family protein [Nocardioides sp. URHA0020]|uniref:DCC1-like thiol-disulfide oxidoreductase family protein n=1 Tax=Nocardioides sp. URHA0020 TaxID=1380392 RepID=UPI0009DD286B|nr:DCC1-like thiol-disulfide oxidoreductase family protein [Nocardioides sp. URHA0020]